MHERILDIGIGRGGAYIDQSPSSAVRIGIDIQMTRLRSAKRRFPCIETVRANAFTFLSEQLPFRSESFRRIDIRFPHADLLYALATNDQSFLWVEMHRVLMPGGVVDVVFDVPSDNTRMFPVKRLRRDIALENPEDHIWRMATNASFQVYIGEMSRQEAYALGSDYGRSTAHKMRLDAGHKTYLLRAEKSRHEDTE